MRSRDQNAAERRAALRPLATRILRRHVSLAQAMTASVTLTGTALLVGGAAVTRTDPEQFPHLGVGLWWAAATVTTVGYGDVVPASPAGRVVGTVLMFVGIASLALLTAIAASAIVVGEVRSEEREIEREETKILSELRDLSERIQNLERALGERSSRGS
jgi:voltage-gated potassium channel